MTEKLLATKTLSFHALGFEIFEKAL